MHISLLIVPPSTWKYRLLSSSPSYSPSSPSPPFFFPLPPPISIFCWLPCTINISCVMWLFWIVRAMCMCPREPARSCVRTQAHTHTHTPVCVCLLYVWVCRFRGCVSVPQYQILLSQLSASLNPVVICLSTSQPSASPSVSLSSFPRVFFFHLNPSVLHTRLLHPSFWSRFIFSSSLPSCLFLPLLWASYRLFTPMPSPSLPLSYSKTLFSFETLSISRFTLPPLHPSDRLKQTKQKQKYFLCNNFFVFLIQIFFSSQTHCFSFIGIFNLVTGTSLNLRILMVFWNEGLIGGFC